MIENVQLKDFAIFKEFEWDKLSNVNLIIGENDTGKSSLLKMLYAITRSLLDHAQDPVDSRWADELAPKLQWTFQPPDLELGKIVRKGGERLEAKCTFRFSGPAEFAEFDFGSSTRKQIGSASTLFTERQREISQPVPPVVFFPPKEVLTTRDAIIETRDRLSVIGFDDTYYDLAKALRSPESYGELDSSLEDVLDGLDGLFPGSIEQEDDGELIYRRGREKYGISQTAEGIKKVGALTQLIRSRHIQQGSVLFFDEPSANLHPNAILKFVELLFRLSQAEVQIFVATHSYVVLKQFELLAREHGESVPLCVLSPLEEGGVEANFADLMNRIPRNSIVDASVDLFNRDVSLELK